jgi:uncharacterized membrane protein YhaH (DUF805 family)
MPQLVENINDAAARFRDFFFSSDGRVSRSYYWLGLLSLLLCVLLIGAAFYYLPKWFGPLNAPILAAIIVLVGITVAFLGAWASWALTVKRLHDRDKSAYWIFLFHGVPIVCQWIVGAFIGSGVAYADGVLSFQFRFRPAGPSASLNLIDNGFVVLSAVIACWAVVELAVRPGISGGNMYGEDPRQR